MGWEALIGTIIGAGSAIAAQFFFFRVNAHKERVWKTREALADFGAAAFAYLEAQQNLAGVVQRYMNDRSTPAPGTMPNLGLQGDSDNVKRQEVLFHERESKAGQAYWSSRERLQSAKAKAYLCSANRKVQDSVQDLWLRLENMKPRSEHQGHTTDGTNPNFITIPLLRQEVDEWIRDIALTLSTELD